VSGREYCSLISLCEVQIGESGPVERPRWTAYDAKYFGITMPKEVPMKRQERAYTSPVWYTPGK
jgi:hypothetical protein